MEISNSVACVDKHESRLPYVPVKDIGISKNNIKADDFSPNINSTKPNLIFNKSTLLDASQLNITESVDRIIVLVAMSIKEIIEINKNSKQKKHFDAENVETSPFYSKRIPNITLEAYLQRIVKYTKMEASSLILTSIYIDRFCEKYEYFLTLNTAYR